MKTSFVIAVAMVLSSSAFAQVPGSTPGTRIDTRQTIQQQRIDRGVASGRLTPAETQRLEARESSIQRQEDRMRARNGGELTVRNRAVLNQRLDATSRAISRNKRN